MNKATASARNNSVFYYEIQSLGWTQSGGGSPIKARLCNPLGIYLITKQFRFQVRFQFYTVQVPLIFVSASFTLL